MTIGYIHSNEIDENKISMKVHLKSYKGKSEQPQKIGGSFLFWKYSKFGSDDTYHIKLIWKTQKFPNS